MTDLPTRTKKNLNHLFLCLVVAIAKPNLLDKNCVLFVMQRLIRGLHIAKLMFKRSPLFIHCHYTLFFIFIHYISIDSILNIFFSGLIYIGDKTLCKRCPVEIASGCYELFLFITPPAS